MRKLRTLLTYISSNRIWLVTLACLELFFVFLAWFAYPVILAATKGDPDAMKLVLQHYRGYIAHLSMQKIRDESGNTYWGIDEDLRERLQVKLMRAVLNFKAD